MDLLTLLASGLATVAHPIALLAPMLFWFLLVLAEEQMNPHRHHFPELVSVAGLVLGGCMLAVTPLPGPLTFADLVANGGDWDLSFSQFAVIVSDRVAQAPAVLLTELTLADERINLAAAVGVVAVILSIEVVLTFLRKPAGIAAIGLVLDIGLTAATGLLTVYLVFLLLWLVNRLNFWVFAVLVVLLQEYRYTVLGLFNYRRRRKRQKPEGMGPLGLSLKRNGQR